MADAREKPFQDHIIQQLLAQGWLLGQSDLYDRERALYREDLLAFVQQTQPQAWDKYCQHYGDNAVEALCEAVVRQQERKGTLQALRQPIKDRGVRLNLCSFKPDNNLNPDALAAYGANRLRVVPELVYSPHASADNRSGRIDLVLFVNGLPVATLELKSEFKQALENAKNQYRFDRPPKDKKTRKAEPLLTFKRGALVHFAASQNEVAMTTKLAGADTFFLPFNRGTAEGGAGNDAPDADAPDQNPTAYLWNQILQPDVWLNLLGRYLHLQVEEKEDANGVKQTKETLIFPRYHQWHGVTSLLAATAAEGPGQKYLVQHSAGSGKSNSIAWLAHQLSALSQADGSDFYDSVIVITDRTVLDSQLQDTIYQFEHADGVVCRISRDEKAAGSKSSQLAEALLAATPIIIVTIQTFPHVLEAIQEATGLKDRRFAVIADEAHSSQTGATARKLREVLLAEELDGEELTAEDVMNATLAARGGSSNISYYAFTATPKGKTLELFGRRPNPDEPEGEGNLPAPFHVYSMRQAIEEGFILDVLQNYSSYDTAYKLAHQNPDAANEVDSKRAATAVARWLRLHPHNISQKVQTIVEHFRKNVAHRLNGEAKAMIVTGSRKEAVRYHQALTQYTAAQGYDNVNPMVAFSGEVVDLETSEQPFTESNMNPGLKGRDMRKAFDTPEYQVMIVANKFQTGFDQPKLVAMYVDKKLGGVDCIQTLSRLNRTCDGKDCTFVLDFVNDPEEVLATFRTYYQTAELTEPSDPNLVYDMMDALAEERIYQRSEVEAAAQAYFDPRVKEMPLGPFKPAVDRYRLRYRDVMTTLGDAKKVLDAAQQSGNEILISNAEKSLAEAKKAKDVLDTFKGNLQSFVRFYEFISQLVDFNDPELEQLSIYATHLQPMLREEVIYDDIDLKDVVMTHYKLKFKRQQDLKIAEDGEAYDINGITASGSHKPAEQQYEPLTEILARLNEMFAGEQYSDSDRVAFLQSVAAKISENEPVMQQIRNNDWDQARLGDLPNAAQQAVIDSMHLQRSLATQYLANPDDADQFVHTLFDVLKKGLIGSLAERAR